jgi:Delta7-sterol 5-desaturase
MNPLNFCISLFILHFFRHYLGPEGIYYLFYKKISNKIISYKIQKGNLSDKQIQKERLWSNRSQFIDIFVFFLSLYLFHMGILSLNFQTPISEIWLPEFGKFILLSFLQDFYFYVTHRLLHHKWLYQKIHLIHHRSILKNPLTSYSVHPVEKLIELLFFPIMIWLFSLHPYTFLLFILVTSVINIFGHSGYEFKWMFQRYAPKVTNTSLFHELHHTTPNTNFSLYFVIWDKLLGTCHKKYDSLYFDKSL